MKRSTFLPTTDHTNERESMVTVEEEVSQSQERLLDSQEIQAAAEKAIRPSVKINLQSLATKLLKESQALERVEKSKAVAETPAAPQEETTKPAPTPPPAKLGVYASIDRFSFDAGSHDSPFVTLYVPLPGVGSIPREQITCDFAKDSFDLVVKNLQDKSYRLVKTNLEKDIDTDKSKIVIKADKVLVKLAKVKGEYGSYDYWSKLTDDKKTKGSAPKKSDPQSSIMDMMKNMYDEGDDQMKKMIGETFMKQQRGELGSGMDAMGGMGGLGGDL